MFFSFSISFITIRTHTHVNIITPFKVLWFFTELTSSDVESLLAKRLAAGERAELGFGKLVRTFFFLFIDDILFFFVHDWRAALNVFFLFVLCSLSNINTSLWCFMFVYICLFVLLDHWLLRTDGAVDHDGETDVAAARAADDARWRHASIGQAANRWASWVNLKKKQQQ